MENEISLKEALKIIDTKDKEGDAYPFDITFRSLQRNSKTGGKLYNYKQVKKLRAKKVNPKKSALLKSVLYGETAKKNPNHFYNRTRNLEMQNGEIRKIHIRLIISINRQKVIY